MRRIVFGLLAAILLGAPAKASIVTIDFFVSAESWQIGSLSTDLPYGLTELPDLHGTLTVDLPNVLVMGQDALDRIIDLDLTVGTQTYAVSDITQAILSPTFFLILMAANDGSNISNGNTAMISDGLNQIFCNGCVTTTGLASGVPEPSTWAMLLIGFASMGHLAMRQERRRAIAG